MQTLDTQAKQRTLWPHQRVFCFLVFDCSTTTHRGLEGFCKEDSEGASEYINSVFHETP